MTQTYSNRIAAVFGAMALTATLFVSSFANPTATTISQVLM